MMAYNYKSMLKTGEKRIDEETGEEVEVRLADKLVAIACKQIKAGVSFKQPRMDKNKKNEDLYENRVIARLKGRHNVPLPIMSGFADTLMSKIDDKPTIKFVNTCESDLKKAKKVTAAWETESSSVRMNWARVDRAVKKSAIIGGRGIYKFFAESDPTYQANLEMIDPTDFYCEPQGGGILEKHKFCGQENIFKTETDLKDGIYDQKQVMKLVNASASGDTKVNEDLYQNKIDKFAAMGLDITSNDFIGEPMFSLTEHYMDWEGTRYYMLLDYTTQTWVRFEKLEELFEDNLYPYSSFATNYDELVFWSKAPADDVRPIAESMAIVFNESLDNLRKRNWPVKAVDPKVFPNPEELREWRPNGLVTANSSEKDISRGIYTFETPDTTNLTVNLVEFLDNMLAKKTGITDATQGNSEDTKVGIFFGNLQQVADRLGLLNKNYSDTWSELGLKYKHGLEEHLTEELAIKIIGLDGVEWDSLVADDLKTSKDLEIVVVGGNAEIAQGEIKSKKKIEALTAILANPTLSQKVSPEWAIEQLLRNGEYEEAEIRIATNIDNYGDEIILSEAAQSIEDIIAGKNPELNRGANEAFMTKIVDFATDNSELSLEIFRKLNEYAMAHSQIVEENKIKELRATPVPVDAEGNPMPIGAPGATGGATAGATGGVPAIPGSNGQAPGDAGEILGDAPLVPGTPARNINTATQLAQGIT